MITEKITSGQKKQLMRVLEDGVNAVDLTKEQADKILKVGNLVQADLKTNLKKHSSTNKFGSAIREFEITVPIDYNHETQIDTSREKALKEKTTRFYGEELTSKNYAKASNELVPGRTYKVKIIPSCSIKNVYHDFIDFLRKQNAILVGGQGLTLVYDLAKDLLPKDKGIISCDELEYLPYKGLYYYVPSIRVKSNGNIFGFGGSQFHTGLSFEDTWSDGSGWFGEDTCLLCFFEK